jgi:hypothetical protein
MLLNRLTCDAAGAEAAQLETLNRFYHALKRKERHLEESMERIPLFHEEALPAHYHPVDVYLFEPSKRIEYTSVITDSENSRRSHRRMSRFMFHEKFIRELITWGYQDACAKHDELENFFHPERAKKMWGFFHKSA